MSAPNVVVIMADPREEKNLAADPARAAMEAGLLTSWDCRPRCDAAQEYVRNHIDWTEAAARTRFPPLEGGARVRS